MPQPTAPHDELSSIPEEGRAGQPRLGENDEGGYFSVTFAILLIPLLLFAALAVDVGFWYTRSMELQRAADSAALAGVVWQPNNFAKATDVAREASRRNGFENGVNGVDVDVQRVTGESRQLDVTITDPHVPSFFGAVVLREIAMQRTARARYVLPVPLGSPLSTFGNQNIPVQSTDPKLWGAINAPYARHESGDPFAVKCAGDPNSVRTCENGLPKTNGDYRADGYRYIVDVPAGSNGRTLTVQILDGRYNTSGGAGDMFEWTQSGYQTNRTALEYELFEADDTALDITDNPSLDGQCSSGPGKETLGNNHSTSPNGWQTLCQVTAKPGQYILTVKSSAIATTTDQGSGSNLYSLRASLSSGDAPRLYAFDDMSIMTNLGGTRANLYLAEVEQVHAGKTLQIDLYDPGDGQDGTFDLQILDPSGNSQPCTYNNPGSTDLDQSSSNCTIRTRNPSASPPNRYNGRWLTISIPLTRANLGSNYTCDVDGATPPNPGPGEDTACWWRLSYLFSSSATPTDRTTWKVKLIGDPVQLVR